MAATRWVARCVSREQNESRFLRLRAQIIAPLGARKESERRKSLPAAALSARKHAQKCLDDEMVTHQSRFVTFYS